MKSETLLMVADSERDANMLYATGLFVPDPFIYLDFGRRPFIVMNDLEIDRACAKAPHCRVASLSASSTSSGATASNRRVSRTSSGGFCANK